MGSVVKLQSVKSFRSFKYNMKSITLASIVVTLSFCLNLVAGKNLPYKGSPSAGAKTILAEVEDTEDNNDPTEGADYFIRFNGNIDLGENNNIGAVGGCGHDDFIRFNGNIDLGENNNIGTVRVCGPIIGANVNQGAPGSLRVGRDLYGGQFK